MIIDDHTGIRTLIRELLDDCLSASRGEAPVFLEYESGQQALQAVTTFVPDLVTVDLRMRGMDGAQCIRQLRRDVPDALVIVVTSLHGESVARHTVLAGADGLVYKDDLTAIQGLVQDHLLALLPA
jgi:DNA-binding NarL/FixJ family response regulator